MSGNNLDSQLEVRLLKKISDLERQMREVRTLQLNSATALDIRGVPEDPDFLAIDDVVAAGGLLTYTFQIFPAGNILTNWSHYFSVYVDLPGSTYNQTYMLPDGGSLSTGQKNMIVTNWADYGRSYDVSGMRLFRVNIRNNDTVSHHVYVTGKFYGPYALQEESTP